MNKINQSVLKNLSMQNQMKWISH